MTTIYFMRHSKAIKPNNINNNDSLQLQNEKWILSKEGEEIAKEKSELEELNYFDIVFSSNYARAIGTAKYFANTINIDERFNERKFGIDNWDQLPSDFEKMQRKDFDYKLENGESLNEVSKREEDALKDILNNYNGKKVLVVGHSTALAALFKKLGKDYFSIDWNYCETFKIIFNDKNEIIEINNIQ